MVVLMTVLLVLIDADAQKKMAEECAEGKG